MKRTFIYDKYGKPHELVREISKHHFVQPDFAEHGGRAKFRERLKQNGSIEVSAKDMAQMKEKWDSRKAEHASKMARNEKFMTPVNNVDVMTERRYEMSPAAKELANRLDGRPVPERKMLIKLAIETQRMTRGR